MDSLTLYSPKAQWTIYADTDTNTTYTETTYIWYTDKDHKGVPKITRRGATKRSKEIVHEAGKKIGPTETMLTYVKKTVRAKLRTAYVSACPGTGILADLCLDEELNEKSGGIFDKPMTIDNGAERLKHDFKEAFGMFKLDGMRCLVMIKDEYLDRFTCDKDIQELIIEAHEEGTFPLSFRSRSGNVMTNNIHRLHMINCLNLIRILCKIHSYPECGIFLDGEMYIHGLSLQQITGMVKKESVKNIEFHIFAAYLRDCSTPFSIASKGIRKAIEFCRDKKMINDLIVPVRTTEVRDVAGKNLAEVFADFLDEASKPSDVSELCETPGQKAAYEGIIVYSSDGLYEYGKRVTSVLKFKFKEDDEAPILGYERGDGKAEDHVYFIVSWNGHKVKIIAAGSVEEQNNDLSAHLANEGEPLLYKFKYMGVTKDGKPRHAVGLGFRHQDDL